MQKPLIMNCYNFADIFLYICKNSFIGSSFGFGKYKNNEIEIFQWNISIYII